MIKILVTGASGFIGSKLINFLIKNGYDVHGITNSQNNTNFKQLSLLDTTALDLYLQKHNFDVVVHLGALIDSSDPLEILNSNYDSTLNLLNLCLKNNVTKFIFASSHAVYGKTHYLPIDENHKIDPKTPYGISKLMGENLCKLFHECYGLQTIILRISSTYGANQNIKKILPSLIKNSITNKQIILHKYRNGFQLMDMIHIDDVCYSILCSIRSKKSFGIYNIGTGQSVTVQSIAEELKKINNVKILIKKIPSNTNHFKYDTTKASSELKFKSKIQLIDEIVKIYKQFLKINK